MLNKLFYSVILTLCFYVFSSAVQANKTQTVSQNTVLKLLSQNKTTSNFLIIDVRTPEEFASGHIKTAVNIPTHKIQENLSLLKTHKDKMIIVYCRSGRRALITQTLLKQNNFTNIYHLEGDIIGWNKAELPLIVE